MKIKGNVALIILSVIAGLLVIISFSIFLNKEEVVELPIKFVEFADYQCPACGYYYALVIKAIEPYSDNVSYEFKHFPLTSIHEYAYNAALAAEGAREQNKFKEYSDKLFEMNYKFSLNEISDQFLTDNKLVEYALELGLDIEKFNSDRNTKLIKDRVDSNINEGIGLSINSTPTFIINGKQFRPQNVDQTLSKEEAENAIIQQFRDYIDSKLKLVKN